MMQFFLDVILKDLLILVNSNVALTMHGKPEPMWVVMNDDEYVNEVVCLRDIEMA